MRVKPRMSELKTVHSGTCTPPFFTSSLPEMTCSATFGESRRLKRSRVDDLLLDLLAEEVVLDEHRGLVADGR